MAADEGTTHRASERGWYRGDCHIHTQRSHGGELTPQQLAAAAREAGLDIIAITEYNTADTHGAWASLAGDDLLVILGQEVVTSTGHWLAIGIDPGQVVDWRYGVRDALAVEFLLPLAARALADEAQACHDRRIDPSSAVRRLHDLRREFPQVVTDNGGQNGAAAFYRVQVEALQRLTEAETARGCRVTGEPQLWGQAAEAAHVASFRWEEAYCRWREAEAGLRNRANRRSAVQAVRAGHRLAADLAAAPLVASLESLAAGAHIDLKPEAEPTTPGSRIPGLTPREQEILTYVVSGHTYAEIAKALVISEKTVSTHISNMLRKTGSVNRLELAELARRLNASA